MCKARFVTRQTLSKHERNRFDTERNKYQCCKCAVETESGRELSEHLDGHRGD